MICYADEFDQNMAGALVLLFHHENGVGDGAEAGMRGRIRDDRFLVHLRDEGKKNSLFLFDMRMHRGSQLFDEFANLRQFRRPIGRLCGNVRRHHGQGWKYLADAEVMNTHDMLD